MAVNPKSLDTPERGAPGLTTRDVVPAAEELKQLRARIERARKIAPSSRELHCRDCFDRGRDAALREIDTEGP